MIYLLYLFLFLLMPYEALGQVTTTTPNIGLTKPCVPGDAGCLPSGHPGWGPIINTDLDIIDAKLVTLNLACTDGQTPLWATGKFSICGTPATVANVTGGAFALTGDLTPSTITADQNNYNPTGLSTASVLRLATDASRSITGLAGGSDGRIIFIYNAGANNLSLTNESGSSTDTNRFAINADITLAANQGIILQYDSTSTRWRAASGISGGGGGGQAADDDLTAIAAFAATGFPTRTSAPVPTWAQRTMTAGSGISITNGAGVAGNPTFAVDSTVWRTTGGTASAGNQDFSGATTLTVPASTGCAPTTDGQTCRNTITGDWYFARNSTAEIFVARSDMNAKTHASLPDLADDQHPLYTGFTAAAGSPAAGSVPRAGWLHIDTTSSDEDLFFGTAVGGNYIRAGSRLDRINEITNGTISASIQGPQTQLYATFSSLSAKVLTFAKTETYASQPSNGAIEILADGASTQECVVFGWTTGGDSSSGVTETMTLNGTTPVVSTKTDWEDIYAVHCPDNTTTTVSFRVDTGDTAIGAVESGATYSANQLSTFIQTSTGGATKAIWFGADSLYGDGAQCPANPTAVQIPASTGAFIPTFICTDDNASSLYGSVKMPPDYNGGTVTFTHVYIQTAANTGPLHGDIAAQCRGNGEAVAGWGSEVAIDDTNVVGSNSNDMTTSAAVTPAGTCAAGDMLYFRYQLDATGTTTTITSLHHVGFNLNYTSN